MKRDELTYFVSRAMNTLFLFNVVGTSYGIVFGLLIMALQELIASLFPPFGLIKWYGFIAIGVLLFNFKPIVKQKYIDPSIERELVYIRQIIKEGNFGEKEKKAIWRNAIYKIIENYNGNDNIGMTENNSDSHNPTPE